MKNKKYQFEIEENNVIRAAIAPMGIDFRPNTRFYMGDYICRIYAIMQYPPTQEYGWVSKINNIAGTIVNFTSTPITETNIVEQLSKIINASRAEAENTRDALQRQRKTKTADDTTRLMARMEENNEKIAKFCCTVMVMGNDEIDFEQKCNRVESIISGVGCKLRCLSRMQKDAWKHISPSYAPVELIGDVGNRPMPVNAFYGGFPFQNSGFNDGVGYYLGVDNDGTPIIFDLWKRDGARTNSNISIIGGSGKGKTTLIKHIIVSELIRGTKVIVIDPETEYKAICDMFREDGISRWIDADNNTEPAFCQVLLSDFLQTRGSPKYEHLYITQQISHRKRKVSKLNLLYSSIYRILRTVYAHFSSKKSCGKRIMSKNKAPP